jgi:hypothetical protein
LTFKVRVYGLFIIFICPALNELKGTFGAIPKTGAKPITIFIANNLGLAVNDLNGPLGAGGYAITAAIALFLVYLYNFTDNFHGLCLSLPTFKMGLHPGVKLL